MPPTNLQGLSRCVQEIHRGREGVRLFQNDGQVMELWELSHHQPVL